MLPPPSSSAPEADTDSTAELPILDAAARSTSATLVTAPPPAAEEPHTRTDTWVLPQPGGAGGEQRRDLEAQLQSLTTTVHALTEQLREAREVLAGKNARLVQVEKARDEAQAAHAAAEQRHAALQAAASSAAPAPAAQGEPLAGERLASERRIAELTADLAQQQNAFTAQAAQLAASERQLVSLNTELQAARAARGAELEQARGALAEAERRAQQAAAQLDTLQAQSRAAQERSEGLQRSLQQLQGEQQSQHGHAPQQAATARGAAPGERLLLELEESRAQAARYFEALQSLEGRRRIAEELLSDLHHEGAAREDQMARVRGELAARERVLREREMQLGEHAARLASLEQQLTSLNGALTHRDAQLRDTQREREGLQQSVARLQGEVASSGERRQALEAQLLQQQTGAAPQLAELNALRAQNQELRGSLESARSATAAAGAESAAHDAVLLRERERARQAEETLGSERQRVGQLEGELATLRGEMEDWGGVLRSAQGHVASIEAAEKRARALEAELAQQRELTRNLQSQSESHSARVRELQGELQTASASVERLEAQMRERGVRLEDLARAPRHGLHEARHVLTDTAANPSLREAARAFADGEDAEEPPLHADGNARLLIYSDGGREVVHVLGRKTSIGRTPDNDLQLDTKFVSRHHAVILAGPESTIIEDLNSTNGVLVNGRRVTRQALQQGDQIAIGRAHYRYELRRADRR